MKNIAAKLVLIAADCRYIQKTGNNEFHRYTYARASDVLAKVSESLAKHGVAVVPNPEILSERDITNRAGKSERITTVKQSLMLVDKDSGESLTIIGFGSGQDAGDKSPMKAQTAATKYAWMTALSIATGDDPENESEEESRERYGEREYDRTDHHAQNRGNGNQRESREQPRQERQAEPERQQAARAQTKRAEEQREQAANTKPQVPVPSFLELTELFGQAATDEALRHAVDQTRLAINANTLSPEERQMLQDAREEARKRIPIPMPKTEPAAQPAAASQGAIPGTEPEKDPAKLLDLLVASIEKTPAKQTTAEVNATVKAIVAASSKKHLTKEQSDALLKRLSVVGKMIQANEKKAGAK